MRHLALVAISGRPVPTAVQAVPEPRDQARAQRHYTPAKLRAFGRSSGAEIIRLDSRFGHAVLTTGDSHPEH